MTPSHLLNFSGPSPTRLGISWIQMASKRGPRRHLAPKILSYFFHAFLKLSVAWGKDGVTIQSLPLETYMMLKKLRALQSLGYLTWEVGRWTNHKGSLCKRTGKGLANDGGAGMP